jgi:hypothetical protein
MKQTVLLFAVAALSPEFFIDVSGAESGGPRIEFATNFLELGKILGSAEVDGAFKLKNGGDTDLVIQPPTGSCECTEAHAEPPVVPPGKSGEIKFTIRLNKTMNGERSIYVRSNDPANTNAVLTFHIDYTPLYRFSPASAWLTLGAGKDELRKEMMLIRSDGKPVGALKLRSSVDWITAVLDPSTTPLDTSAKLWVTLKRPSRPPGPISERIDIFPANETGRMLQTLPVSGDIFGEVAADPASMYWVIPFFGKNPSDYPESVLTKKITLRSVLNRALRITKASTDIKGLSIKASPDGMAQTFELTLKFDEAPREFSKGKVIVNTSLASLPELHIPLTIAVPPQ